MRRLFILLSLSSLALLSTDALAADLEAGKQIFIANCSACHAGGNNVLMAEKTLKTDALEKNEMKSVLAITNQVKNGKNAMPAFGGRLADDDIENVANYVLDQAENGW